MYTQHILAISMLYLHDGLLIAVDLDFFYQVICDASNMITNVEAKWPGSVHDARMYRESNLNAKFQQGALHFMKYLTS